MDAYRKQLIETDPDVFACLAGEERRQAAGVELIPSENYTWPEVLAVLGSVFTNKYSEGYPGRRYYGGQEFTDRVENLARERARELVGKRLPGVQRDLTAAREYWAQFEGRTSRATRRVNNAYLRSNRVPDGVLSYGRSVELLIAYARSRGGWLVR